MLDRLGSAARAWSFALGVALAPAAATAQPKLLEVTSDGATCTPLADCFDAEVRCPGTLECVPLGGATEREVCLPHDPVFCCASDADCLGVAAAGATLDCVEVSGLGSGVCVRPDTNYCGEPIALRRLIACHTTGTSRTRVRYGDGDCDRDGATNGQEIVNDRDPCLPERLGVWVPTDTGARCVTGHASQLRCDAAGDSCLLPDDTAGVCVQDERTGEQPICSTPPHVFCCGGMLGVGCPTGEQCTLSDVDDGYGVCTPAALLCNARPTEDELLACHTFGGTLTSYEEGDCDSDGIPNGVEADGRHCIADVSEPSDGGANTDPDGGSASGDAGSAGPDAGGDPRDAGGAPFDGGSPIAPSFNGGGGCTCRSARGAPPPSHAWLALAGLALALASRRR